jgi:quinohemoprotein ethanol dehydrogenase
MPQASTEPLIRVAAIALVIAITGCQDKNEKALLAQEAALVDNSGGADWTGFGRTYGEQHFSPLFAVNATNVASLGLTWSLDLPVGNSTTGPVVVDGVIYFAQGYSVVHAVKAGTGKLLWMYDPKAAEAAGEKLRQGWGSRGIAYWNGKVFTGTADGRLIAIDARTGAPVWSARTFPKNDVRYITGAPRVFDGKVIIGHGGADIGPIRGYVTTYDAETGKQLWRFYTVPGNPANGFENGAMRAAAKTWSGEWWKYGGGGTVWNAMTYDSETHTIILGTGNGFPWNHKIRSAGKGDNLFLCSIVGLNADTGAYKWHYQINPGESWDYNAAMDMELADLKIDGKMRKVLMTAPKNGFFYVIDRTDGRLVSAEPIAKVNWASRIDLKTGRPVENPAARYPNGKTFELWPGGALGAHSWLPMAFSRQTGLAYIPVIEASVSYNDKGIDLLHWTPQPGGIVNAGSNVNLVADEKGRRPSSLVAWDPVQQKQVWRIPTSGLIGGGVLATAGKLVFQGEIDGHFNAYHAVTGRKLWSYAAQAPVTYMTGGTQYLTVITGSGTAGASFGPLAPGFPVDYRTQARRVLTFAIGGTATLPPSKPFVSRAPADPNFRRDPAMAARGEAVFGAHCIACHGISAIAGGNAPDLRLSSVPQSESAFSAIVHEGALVRSGMPQFGELDKDQLTALRTYIRSRSADLRHVPK